MSAASCVTWSAPGRVNLIGEHTDYNGGFVLPFAIDLRTRVTAERRDDGRVAVASASMPGESVSVRLEDLAPGSVSGWAAYPLGVIWALRERGLAVGLDVLVESDLPVGVGLSSSAALECAVAAAGAELGGIPLAPPELAAVAQQAENEFVGVPCGPMDQLAAMLCREGHALFIDTGKLTVSHVPLDPAAHGCELAIVDTGVQHAHRGGAYAERRAQCTEAARVLGVPSLQGASASDVERQPDPVLARRVRHVVTENARVLETVALLADGRLRAIGPVLTASHASLRDDFEVSCAELDLAVEAALAGGALGARLTGGGFGGAVVVLAETGEPVVAAVAGAFAEAGFAAPRIRRVAPSAGARRE